LYAKGNYSVLEKPQLAMVGSRKATPRALEMAYGLAKDLAAKGIVITSGLALGIDTAAHQGALSASGETVAVMANGLARVYPPSNQRLAADIAKKGVLISEQPPWMEPKATLFPRRNRIVSGLSQGVLVVQANKKSGSLITARLALEQNREVMAMPGESGSEEASGCHWLLKQGAALVENADDVYAAMGWDLPERIETTSYGRKNPPDNPFNEVENTLLACIDSTDTSLEMIYKRYSGDHCKVLSLLSQLELEGLVQRTIFGYCRC
jgi:DNA processing protein